MTFRASLPLAILLVALSVACSPDAEPPRRPVFSPRDSLRVRREAAIATRPDTFGTRVDSMRILHPPAGASAAVPWVVVISEFQCEACRRLALGVLPAIRRDIAERGVAHMAFVNAPRDEHFNARFAAHAALCAASAGRFWEMHDSLFATLGVTDDAPYPLFGEAILFHLVLRMEGELVCSRTGSFVFLPFCKTLLGLADEILIGRWHKNYNVKAQMTNIKSMPNALIHKLLSLRFSI